MDSWFQNIRYAFRVIRHNPGAAAVVILALALGIGANIAIFSVVNAVLLRPLPYQDSDRLVQLWGQMLSRNIPFHFVPYPEIAELRAQNQSFESMSAYRPAAMNLLNHGDPRQLNCLLVNESFFPMVGVPLLYGRGFTPEEDKPGAPGTAVMSYALWRETFGGAPGVVGRTITLDGKSYAILGVLPEGFQLGGAELDLYLPLAASGTRSPESLSVSVGAYAKLKSGVLLKAAQTDIDTICARLDQQYPRGIPRSVRVWGVREFMVRNVQLSLWILMGAVGLVLLIACANVANILLARTDARRREMAIRAALGADRKRIIRQILSESVLLGLGGGALGALLASWGVQALISTQSRSYPLLRNVALDASVLIFSLLISVLAGIAFGIGPALAMAREGSFWNVLAGSLKEASPIASGSRSNRRVRGLLVVSEVAISLMLLIGAGLLIRSFLRIQQVDAGFNPDGVATAAITLPPGKYPDGSRRLSFYQEFLGNLARAPEIEAAGIVDYLPLGGANAGVGIYPEGRALQPGEAPIAWIRWMSEGYFRAMSIPLVAGRQFDERDRPPAPPVAIVNRTLARRYWSGEDPIGKRFRLGPAGQNVPVFTIIGVAGDVRHTNLAQEPEAEFFLYYRQSVPARVTIAVRGKQQDAARLAAPMRQALAAADKDLPMSKLQTMEEIVSASISSRRLTMLLLGIFAGLALLLAAVGIYGVLSYSVAQRKHEMGVRLALGAPRDRVLWMVIGEAMLLAAIGELIGLAGTVALRRLLDSQLYGMTAMDPLIFIAVPAILAAVAFVAVFIPAWRAMHIDPLIALRRE
jgi:putative ABC transport system permease protein